MTCDSKGHRFLQHRLQAGLSREPCHGLSRSRR